MGWSDNFNGGSGVLSDRFGWGTSRNTTTNADNSTRDVLTNNEVQRNANDQVFTYILADYAPGSADYSVEVQVKVQSETGMLINSGLVRGAVGASAAVGYYAEIVTDTDFIKVFKCNGTSVAQLGTSTAIGASYDWTTYQTIRIEVSGSSTTTINVYINDVLRKTVTDSSSPITDKGNAGLVMYFETGNIGYYDNYSIIDGAAEGIHSTGGLFSRNGATVSESPWSDDTWLNPESVTATGGTLCRVTAATFDDPDQSYILKAYNFDTSYIPDGANISGVSVSALIYFANGGCQMDMLELLTTASARAGTNQCNTPVGVATAATSVITKGGSSDTWGNALDAAWVKSSAFGVGIGVSATAANCDVFIDWVKLEVFYTPFVAQNFPVSVTFNAAGEIAQDGPSTFPTQLALNANGSVTKSGSAGYPGGLTLNANSVISHSGVGNYGGQVSLAGNSGLFEGGPAKFGAATSLSANVSQVDAAIIQQFDRVTFSILSQLVSSFPAAGVNYPVSVIFDAVVDSLEDAKLQMQVLSILSAHGGPMSEIDRRAAAGLITPGQADELKRRIAAGIYPAGLGQVPSIFNAWEEFPGQVAMQANASLTETGVLELIDSIALSILTQIIVSGPATQNYPVNVTLGALVQAVESGNLATTGATTLQSIVQTINNTSLMATSQTSLIGNAILAESANYAIFDSIVMNVVAQMVAGLAGGQVFSGQITLQGLADALQGGILSAEARMQIISNVLMSTDAQAALKAISGFQAQIAMTGSALARFDGVSQFQGTVSMPDSAKAMLQGLLTLQGQGSMPENAFAAYKALMTLQADARINMWYPPGVVANILRWYGYRFGMMFGNEGLRWS